ncbi:hypothetical protein [Nostoc sp. MG11]|uniref:hypothetical protein n=1 Tax=Nostoc sp. MG11 TaxID=2721166 RepID=UPI0018685DB5|nr:hypothetical protein [Nostoc sp. MG11]
MNDYGFYSFLVRLAENIIFSTDRPTECGLEARKQGDDGKGFLAPYLANKYMLGQGQDGWQRVQQAYKGRDRTKYFADLRKFLRETGYIK